MEAIVSRRFQHIGRYYCKILSRAKVRYKMEQK